MPKKKLTQTKQPQQVPRLRTRGNGESVVFGKDRNGSGRYQAHFPDLIYEYVLNGMDPGDIAERFKVTERTLNDWRKKYPEFKDAWMSGDEVLLARAENALTTRALGFTKKIYREIINPDKIEKKDKPVIQFMTEVYYPPSEKALEFLLTNKRPGKWSHRKEVIFTPGEKKAMQIATREEALKEVGTLENLDTNVLVN